MLRVISRRWSLDKGQHLEEAFLAVVRPFLKAAEEEALHAGLQVRASSSGPCSPGWCFNNHPMRLQ